MQRKPTGVKPFVHRFDLLVDFASANDIRRLRSLHRVHDADHVPFYVQQAAEERIYLYGGRFLFHYDTRGSEHPFGMDRNCRFFARTDRASHHPPLLFRAAQYVRCHAVPQNQDDALLATAADRRPSIASADSSIISVLHH